MEEILRYCFLWQETTYFITLERNGFGTVIPLSLHHLDSPTIEIGPHMHPIGTQLTWHYIVSELLTNIHLPPSLNRDVWEIDCLRSNHQKDASKKTKTILLQKQEALQEQLGSYLQAFLRDGHLVNLE